MKRKAVLSVFTLALSLVLALCGCGKQQEVKKTATDVATTAKQIADNTYLVRAGEEDTVTAEDAEVKSYDISVTTFNVGGFGAGVDSGIHTSTEKYNPTDAISRWKVLLDYDNNYANHYFTSDIYALQEFTELFYYDDIEGGTGEKLMTEDIFSNVFNDLQKRTGVFNGLYVAQSALATSNLTDYTIKNVTGGQLSGKYTENSRFYLKGYVEINGIDIAVYCCHMGWSSTDDDISVDSYMELIDLMNQDEYCIVMGDMNSSTIGEYMTAAGYNIANMGAWGNINTWVNGNGTTYIDNIFVSPNIDIVYAECAALEEDFLRAYSDHRPLTAYLKINPDAAGITASAVAVGSDGYTTEYR